MITRHTGLPIELIRSLGLRVSEILEKTKDLNLTVKEAEEIEKQNWIDSTVQRNQKIKTPNLSFFPNKIPFDWNQDNFGPIVIPKKGVTRRGNVGHIVDECFCPHHRPLCHSRKHKQT